MIARVNKLKRSRVLLLLPFLFFCMTAHAFPGFRQIKLSLPENKILNLAVWYPSRNEGITENVGDNAAFTGVTVVQNAPPVLSKHPLLVISHGYNGNWRNLSWIAEAMASQGYIVASPDHPGTTTFDQNLDDARKLWTRPEDISLVIDSIINSPKIFGYTDTYRIAALGHSLGGWTVMSLAGAIFDPEKFLNDCRGNNSRGDCKLESRLGINNKYSWSFLSKDYRDKRVKTVVSLDLGLAPGFTEMSLKNIKIPVLILAAEDDQVGELPVKQESSYIATHIPSHMVNFKIVNGATHFSFMQICKKNAEYLINKESPGDGVVCHDGIDANREKIHAKLVHDISLFINKTLDYHP